MIRNSHLLTTALGVSIGSGVASWFVTGNIIPFLVLGVAPVAVLGAAYLGMWLVYGRQ